MIVLHGIWYESSLHLWAEGMPVGPPGESGPPTAELTTPGSCVLGADAVRDAVAEWASDMLLPSLGLPDVLTLRLPCIDASGAGDRPLFLPSQQDVEPVRSTDLGAVLSTMDASVLRFSAPDAFDLLCDIQPPYPQNWSRSLHYWARLMRWVRGLLHDGQFVPDIERLSDDVHRALWRPFVDSDELLSWLERHTMSMPHECRAAVALDSTDPIQIVEQCLDATVDRVVRRIAADDPFFRRAENDPSLEGKWVSALLGPDPVVRGDAETVTRLADEVRTWVGKLDRPGLGEPLILHFTLNPPVPSESAPNEPAPLSGQDFSDEHSRAWVVKLNLESATPMPRAMGIAEIWAQPTTHPTLWGRRMGNRRDQLLQSLSDAGELFPPLARVQGPPTRVELSLWEANSFLCEWGPMLRSRGFKVTLPSWASASENKLGMRLILQQRATDGAAQEQGYSGLGLEGLVEFDWRMAVGDLDVSLAELEALSAQQLPLVYHRGHWLQFDQEAAERALSLMRKTPKGTMTLRDALRLAWTGQDSDLGLPVVGVSGSGWLEKLLDEAPAEAIERLPQPVGLKGELRAYQCRGLDWLSFHDRLGIGCCLADDMGLGKTIQLIALLLNERERGENPAPTLVFAPASVVGNWEREIARFAPTLRVLVHHGTERTTGKAFSRVAEAHDVVVTTYALGHRDRDILREVSWQRVVLDEAQKIKNPHAAQSVAIRSIDASRRVALTGTPIENHLSELWSIMETLNPGLLGTAGQFRERFLVPVEKLRDQQRTEQLRRLIRPFVLRRLKSDPDILDDLPEKMEMRVYCNLTQEQAALYQQVVDDMLFRVQSSSGMQRRGLILSMITRLKQICNHPESVLKDGQSLDERSGKCERLVEMLEEVLAEEDAALVFTQFREMGNLLEKLLADRLKKEILFLHGGVPTRKREELIDRFQDPNGATPIFLLSLRAGGLGLNLTAANHVFHFDRWWSPAVEDQATDRAHRIGQTRRVQVHKFVCIGTIEDRIDQLLEQKKELANAIIQSGDHWLTELSTEQLRDYVTLSRDAVA